MIVPFSLLLYHLTKVLSLLKKGIYSDGIDPDSMSVCEMHVGFNRQEYMGVRRLSSNGGSLLVPPVGGSVRMAELGPLLPQDILLEGSNWKESSVDIAIAGECQKAYCSNHL